MMNRLLLIFLIVFTSKLYAQETQDTIWIEGIVPKGWVMYAVDGPAYRYENGVKVNGLIIDTFENGQLKHKGNYLNGELNGTVENYHPNGKIESIGSCKRNKKIGIWKFYYDKGSLESEIDYADGWYEPRKWVDYYQNGKVEIKYEFSKNGKYLLYDIEFNTKGDTLNKSIELIDKGEKIYLIKTYDEKGKLHEIWYERCNLPEYKWEKIEYKK